MCPHRKNFSPVKEVLPWTYPVLHTQKTWYVDFRSLDPATGEMRRKKYMLDGIPKKTDRRKRAGELIESLCKMLRSGWSPWVREESTKCYYNLSDALEKYERTLDKIQKIKTKQSYTSRLNVLREYISLQILPPKYVYQYTTAFVSEFLDWLYLEKEVSGRTRNNYRQWCSSLAAFFIEREYITTNPVDKIKPVEESPKKRLPLSPDMLMRLKNHLAEKDPFYLLACMLEYYTMIRPQELCCIRIGDISIKDQSIFISAAISKNKRDGKVALNKEVILLMIDLKLFNYPSEYFIFGDKLRPGAKQASSEIFRRQWIKVRNALRWSDEYQFYSLKDSGIRDLANAKGIVIARDQARHTDISTTNKYLQGRDIPVHEEAKSFEGNL